MAKSLLDLAESLEKRAKTIQAETSALAVKAATALVSYLAWRTPVDTSTALSNWQVNLNNPATSFINAYAFGDRGSTQGASAQATIAAAQRVLTQKKPGEPIYIVNNAPYIADLNRGSSKQAPPGFVEGGVMIARAELRK